MTAIKDLEFLQLRDLIEQESGISLAPGKEYLLETRLTTLMVESGCDCFSQLYHRAVQDSAIRARVVDAMTTNETLWFRDEHPYHVLSNVLLPALAQDLASGRKQEIRIWSAACSTGQEPYSIAMTIHEFVKARGHHRLIQGGVSILATDLSSSALQVARMGRYDTISISRGLMPDLRDRYFQQEGRTYILNPEVKQMVRFEPLNLCHSLQPLGMFDIIFLRNVAIYFTAQFKSQLFSRLAKQLSPDGVLFLGASESMIGYSDAFEMCEYQRAHYYRVKSPVGARSLS